MQTTNRLPDETIQRKPDMIGDEIRNKVLQFAKDFKTSWLQLGQHLYAVWNDKMYHAWGFEKFEYYTEGELGLKKDVAMKLLKTYIFLEENEPAYLQEGFREERSALKVPGLDEVNLLRMARQKKELLKDDYQKIKKDIFDKGKNASVVRKDLTALMKERKQVDPDQERQQRVEIALKRTINTLKVFKKDMEVLKLVPHEVLEETKALLDKLESQLN